VVIAFSHREEEAGLSLSDVNPPKRLSDLPHKLSPFSRVSPGKNHTLPE